MAVGAALGLTNPLTSNQRHGPSTYDIGIAALTALVLLRATWWVYLQHSAETLVQHHKMFRLPGNRLSIVVWWTALMVAFGYAAVELVRGAA